AAVAYGGVGQEEAAGAGLLRGSPRPLPFRRPGATPAPRANPSRGAGLSLQRDKEFAVVRDPKALDRLPESERSAWKKLWADVETTLARAEAGSEAGP